MKKILLIIEREYLTRVKKKSFLIMTILGPMLMATVMIAPVYFATLDDSSQKNIAVIDSSGKYSNIIKNTEAINFEFVEKENFQNIKQNFKNLQYTALLLIDTSENSFTLYSDKQVETSVVSYLEETVEKYKETLNLSQLGISQQQLDSAKENIEISAVKWTEEGDEKSLPVVGEIIGFVLAIIIYMFIFMYGVQVMRGVIEEKTSRIVEVIISSVKPFELMAGKIIGIALVALTQFLLWIILTLVIVTAVIPLTGLSGQEIAKQNQNMSQMTEQTGFTDILPAILNFNWPLLIFVFIFFFIGGYLLYSSMFAAIGSAVDNETDTQQFMLPVTIPLILAIVAAQGILRDPEGSLAFWFSIIPFTSPIIMPIRVAMERVETWEILLSFVLLIITFIGGVWLAAKIYRTGILMYGKKVSYKELWKWLRYK